MKWNFLALILRNILYFLEKCFSFISGNRIFLCCRKRKPQTNFWYFLQRKLYLYFGKGNPEKNSLYFRKRNFLIIRKRYIQNPVILRTLTYSEHCQISMMKCFQKWLLSYIPGNEAFLSNISLIFQRVTFWAWKGKRNYY